MIRLLHVQRGVLVLLALLVSVVALAAAASCTQPVDPIVEISAGASSLVAGQTTQLVVTRRFPHGSPEPVSDRVTYTSSDLNVASVSDKGVLLGGPGAGTAVIRAVDATGVSASLSVEVAPVRVQTIEITPAPPTTLRTGTDRQFNATAHLNNGLSRDMTAQVLWTSSNDYVATVGHTPSDYGLVHALGEGDAIIAALDPETLVAGQAAVSVRGAAPELAAIVVMPNPGAVDAGAKLQFSAMGVYSDGTRSDLTRGAQWSSSREGVATVDATGLVTGVAAGEATITAGAQAASVDAGVDASASIAKGSASVTVR